MFVVLYIFLVYENFLSINKENFCSIVQYSKYSNSAMYNHNKKDAYRRKIEELLTGKKKHSRTNETDNSSNTSNEITPAETTAGTNTTDAIPETRAITNTNVSNSYIKYYSPFEGIRKNICKIS